MIKGIAILLVFLLFALPPRAYSAPSDGGFGENGGETGVRREADIALLFPEFRPRGRLTQGVGTLAAGTEVELLSADPSSYAVALGSAEYEVPRTALIPLPPALPPLPAVDDKDVSAAAAALGLSSETPYLLWVDLCRLQTYLLTRNEAGWSLLRRIPCSAGDLAHPTPRGRFTVGAHRLSLGKTDSYTTVYALHLRDDYFLHSVLLAPEGNEVSDGRLGARISHGCIRHSVEDSRYLYRTVPDGTAVMIR